MRFLSVAARELRSAARQKATYRVRWITAAIFFGLLVWLLWAFGGFTNQRAAPQIFRVYSVLTLLYCLFISTARTADCISGERREGTLGLLFLTNLNSGEIILGKLCSSALASVYGLMAIFPMLALPLLMGGITLGNFGRTVLALLNGILSALAAGFLASVVCKRQFTAVAFALSSTLSLAGGLMLGAAVANSYGPTRSLANWLAAFSPIHTLMAADITTRRLGPSSFWNSAGAVAGTSLCFLALTTLLLARTWRDRSKRDLAWYQPWFWRRSRQSHSATRAALRRRLLGINPFFWLAAPKPVSAPVFMFLAVVMTALTVYVAAPHFSRTMGTGSAGPVLGYLFAWMWTGLAIHALVLYYGATTASQRVAEDKQAGALELILCTPTTERTISRGLWLAYARKMMFPALLAVLVHMFFIWQFMVMAVLDPPGQIPPGATAGELFWSALLERPLRGRILEWQFSFMVHTILLILLQLMLAWLTLGWVGRWLGLRMKHAGFAPMASVALLLTPPILLFSLACYLADKFNLYRLPERRFLPMMMWLALAIGIGHCLGLSLWAASHLRHQLRSIAMSRYQPLPAWRWRFPTRRTVARFAIASFGFPAIVVLVVVSYYGYQNWRGKQAWRTFQTTLKQSGEPFNTSQLLAAPAPKEANFARSSAFLSFLSETNSGSTNVLKRLKAFDLLVTAPGGNPILMDWSRQTNSPLLSFVNSQVQPTGGRSGTNRFADATAILQDLESQSGKLRELAAAADRLPVFQISTNRDARAVLRPNREPVLLLERLHLLFQVRACALLALDRNHEAAEDVMTGLHLARLARQLPDVRSMTRVQGLLARSLQPLWDGLSQHAWTEPELAAFQRELARFNLLADYTNAVRRVVLAHIDIWRAIADRSEADLALPDGEGGYMRESAWQLQPRAWWYDSCIQIHNVGRNAIDQVDVAAGRIQPARNWSDLNGMPLDPPSMEFLQQTLWWAANPGLVTFVQTSINQAVIACALDRFRLMNHSYPETLEQLVPTFLDRIPRDAISGRPMIYQLEQGSFILRGVGPNGIDDRKNKAASDDWLWTYPTNTPSAGKL